MSRQEINDTRLAHSRLSGECQLSYVWAEKAHFYFAQVQSASLADARLQGAELNKAQLQGASLSRTHLQGASLYYAELQGASLDGAQLQGASLRGAQLQGASLMLAQLQGASLEEADLQGASLYVTQLQGAWFHLTQLQGVLFGHMQVPDMSQLFPGLSLDPVGLPKPGPIEAQLQGALFVDVCAWRADARHAAWKDTRVVSPTTSQKTDEFSKQCERTAARFADLKQLISDRVPEGNARRAAMEVIEQRLDPDPTKTLEGEDEMAKVWAAHERASPTPQVYEKSVAGQWRTAGCAGDGAPYVLRALLARMQGDFSPFAEYSPERTKLAGAFLDEANCPGAP